MVYREGVRKNGLRCVSGGSAFPVSPGAKLPAAFLLPFVAEDKRKWPRIGQFFCQNCVLYARTNHEAVFLYALMPHGIPFLDVKKGGKEAPGGKAP